MKSLVTAVLCFLLAGECNSRVAANGVAAYRAIAIVVPFQAGGSADLHGAHAAAVHGAGRSRSALSSWKNRSGAGGSIGTAYVAEGAGGRLHAAVGDAEFGNVTQPAFIYSKLPYNP